MKHFMYILLPFFLLNVFCNESRAENDGENSEPARYYKISVEEYQQKVYASWLGQIVGNVYGLPHENKYIDEPGPETFPFGYGSNLNELKKVNGAFSDDDTDVEYIYLLQMEKYGPEPSYTQLTRAWMHHIRERVWLANRAALGLMHFGYTPPFTGMKANNPHWFQIDPQLVNEIWAVTAPGMVKYATEKSAWAARITNDDWGIEPTIHYGAMFAAAFFESDIYKLIDMGTAALPKESRFAKTVEDMKALYRKYPADWKLARQEMMEKYYQNEPLETKTIWNANLNGACGILALLYGKGDFQTTLDMAVVMGFDADNQTATMCGLIGLIQGEKGIPEDLLFPVKEWKKPFNDRYINISRYDMPDVGIGEMTSRMASMGEKIILSKGGRKISENGKDYYLINKNAGFVPPLEFPIGPEPVLLVGTPVNQLISMVGEQPAIRWEVLDGQFPEGIQFKEGRITGTPDKPGRYELRIQIQRGEQKVARRFNLVVRGENLASSATKILSNVDRVDVQARDSLWLSVSRLLYTTDIEAIRDGVTKGEGSTYYSIDGTHVPKIDYYGYQWDHVQQIASLAYHVGSLEEIAGWFTTLQVEYKDDKGVWKPVEGLVMTPPLVTGNQPFNKPHFVEYTLSFKPVETKAIRIIGDAGGGEHWYGKPAYFTSISELSVYEPLTEDNN